MNNVLETLSGYIREEVGFSGELIADADLLETRVLDSFSIVEIASYIQSSFDVELEAEDLTRENFCTLSNMVELISRRSTR